MTKEEVWAKFCELNPEFHGVEKVCLVPERIKKMIETTYKYAYEAGFERGKFVADSLRNAVNPNNGADIFKDVFGGGFKK